MITEILFIFIFTLILVGLLVPLGRYRTYRSRFHGRRVRIEEPEELTEEEGNAIGIGLTMLFFFLLLFPLIIAASFWIGPYGPVFMEISWVPIVVTGILLALLIAALSPREPKVSDQSIPNSQEPIATGVAALFGIAFFVLLFGVIGLIVAAFV